METGKNYLNWTMDDIVFDNRNKDYGAYQLRIITKKNVRTGLLIAIFSFAAILVLSQVDWGFLAKKDVAENETVVNLTEPPPLDNKPPPPTPPPPPPPTRPTVKFVEMIVKKQKEVHEDEPPPPVPVDDKVDISTKTQEGDPNAKAAIEEPVVSEAPVVEQPKIFTFVEQNPQFPGGDGELMKFLQKNIQYPQMERDNDIQGKVLLRFVVMEDGSVSDVQVIRAVSPGLDKEAVRVVKMLPKFAPGKQQGKPVRVYFNLPVVFRLQ